MRLLLSLLALVPLTATAADTATPGPDAGQRLAHDVAAAAGVDCFGTLKRLTFTWHMVPKDITRRYDWDLVARSVAITSGGTTVTVPCDHPPEASNEAAVVAHKGFVNDNYWALFCLHIGWDSTTDTDLGAIDVPQFPDLGKRHALAVQYPQQGGYTPGDKYILYLGDDHLPVAWSFHKGGAEAPTLVVRWLDWTVVGGIHVPTRFVSADGSDFIRIEGAQAE
jgi:hypothetical protein